MNQYVKRAFFSGMILTLVLASIRPSSVQAAVIYDTSLVQPAIAGTQITVKNEQTGDYLDPVNTYTDGTSSYYLITQDKSKSSFTSITYDGSTFPLTSVWVGNDLHAMILSGKSIFSNEGPLANSTVFFDDGTYNDSDSTDYTGLSQTNLSLIGLNKQSNGEPAVKITRSPRSNANSHINNTMERYIIAKQNIYLQNIIFDGQGYDMYPTGNSLSKTDPNYISKSRGEYFFYFSGGTTGSDSAGFVMKDCILENIGADKTDSGSDAGNFNKNVAMNFYKSTGQHNFENVTIRNAKTTSVSGVGLGIISFNETNGNYFKKLTIVADNAYNSISRSIKVENVATTTIPENQNAAVFTENISLPTDDYHNHIYIQSWNYDKVVVPTNYRYAQFSTINGNSTGSSAILVYQDVLPAVVNNKSILDLHDKSWLVQNGQSVSITTQLSTIKTTITKAGTRAPEPNIKISANASGEIGSFSIPSFTGNDVRIVANPNVGDLFSSTTLVPFTAGGTITGNTSVASLKLFNFDFHTKAKYTLQETVSHRGLNYITLSDPNEGGTIPGYPVYSTFGYSVNDVLPIFTNINSGNFANCKFTSLANEIEIAPPSSTAVLIGQDLALTAALKDSDTNSYTGTGFIGTIKNTADDQTIKWFSSDPSIATVNQNTGVATGVSTGAVKIFAKANDSYNQGEIERPFASVNLTVRPPSHILGLTVISSADHALRGARVTFIFTITNLGLDPNPNTVFTNTLPEVFDIVDATADRGAVTTTGNTITVDFGTLAVGETIDVIITTVVNEKGQSGSTVTNSASVSSADNLANDTALASVKIVASESADNSTPLAIPVTGFKPGMVTLLPAQSAGKEYGTLGGLWLEIPTQSIQMKIVGVPLKDGEWDITWLGNNAGYLEGSAYPTLKGNSVLTGHNYLASGLPGPFVNIKNLQYGDEIIVHAFGQKSIYQVQTVEYLRPQDVKKAFKHAEEPLLTLLTCNQYDKDSGTYKQRVAVRAVLVAFEAE